MFKKNCFKKIVPVLWLVFVGFTADARQQITPSNALAHYLHNGDTTYSWTVKDSFSLGTVKGYDLLLISQHWHQYTWKHQLTILAPDANKYDGALLFVTGGHNNKKTQQPNWDKPDDDLIQVMAKVAVQNKAMVAIINQVPNEPLFDSLVEDQIISYTLHRFKEDGDYSWPLLFPMVKSAVRAMDAVQAFSKHRFDHPIDRFVVSGASKRGWTTWLTGASDPRVAAIGPMVIDVLNMPVNLSHQMKAYGSYSVEIQDYVKLGIVQGIQYQSGQALVTMIDPYSYRKKLTMPKMIFMGTNDPYWVIDNIKNYLPEIPGDNLLNYTPNAGHGLNDGVLAFPALSAFFGITMAHDRYPKCSWKTKTKRNKILLTVKASKSKLLGAKIWYADSEDMDFRNEKFHSRDLDAVHVPKIKAVEVLPQSGYHVFYMELTYENPNGGKYTVCTRTFMTDTKNIL